jgi:spermidine/putrescine-binding protein
MPNGLLDYAQMLLGSGLLNQIKMDPYKKGISPMQTLEQGAAPYRGGGTVRAYHGTKAPQFERFDLSKARDPGERGVFFTPDKAAAESYGKVGKPGGNRNSRAIPVDITLKNTAIVDFAKLNQGNPVPYGDQISRAIRAAKGKKKDFLIVRGVDDIGGPVDQIIALNPKGLVKNAITGGTMFGMGGLLSGALDRQEPEPPR